MVPQSSAQRYGPTAGTISGWFGLVVCAVLVVALLVNAPDLVSVRWILGIAAVAVVIWAMMLRPVIIVQPPVVVLRNPFSSWLVPLAAVEVVDVRVITRIEAGGNAYDAVAVGRRIRKMVRSMSPGLVGADPEPSSKRIDASTPEKLADLMTEQILAAAAEARATGQQADAVRRVWALPELVALTALVAALVVTLLL